MDSINSYPQRHWEHSLQSYERSKKALELAQRVKHQRSIEYWSENIKRIEKEFPILKNHE